MMVRPTFHKGLYWMVLRGPRDDFARAMQDRDYLAQVFREMTKRPNAQLGDVKALAEWR